MQLINDVNIIIFNFYIGLYINFFNYSLFQQWELVVVSKLGWDLAPVTASDVLEHLLQRLPETYKSEMVYRHSTTFVALAITGECHTRFSKNKQYRSSFYCS